MKSIPKAFLAATLAASLIGASAPALANKPANITNSEMAMAPRYCPNTMGFPEHRSPATAGWVDMVGPGFFHLHHYCWALITLRRAERSSIPAVNKRYMRMEALGDFQYVVKNTDDSFILLPEILTWIGRVNILLGDSQNAATAFAKARTVKPDYWPAYAYWAEYLQSKGMKGEAMEIVKSGLQNAPEAKRLHSLFRALGGKPGEIPPPIAKAEPVPEKPASEQQADETPASPPAIEQKP